MASEFVVPDIEVRVVKLEEMAQQTRDHLARMDTRLDFLATRIESTREEVLRLQGHMHEALHGLTWKLIGVNGALVAAAYFIARTVH